MSKLKRLARSLVFLDHPVLKWWHVLFFILPFVFSLVYLKPVFVYYVYGVPKMEELEAIMGVWRVVGHVRSRGRYGGDAPDYAIETENGFRKVYCGFPAQKLYCDVAFWVRNGDLVTAYFDKNFGVLAVKHHVDVRRNERTGYETGIFVFAKLKKTIYRNHGAHYIFLITLAMYLYRVRQSWVSPKKEASSTFL